MQNLLKGAMNVKQLAIKNPLHYINSLFSSQFLYFSHWSNKRLLKDKKTMQNMHFTRYK